jgi:hypothetical protein
MVRSRDLYNNLLSQGVSPGDAGKEVDSNLDKWKTDVSGQERTEDDILKQYGL